jgi:glutamine amidotransferase
MLPAETLDGAKLRRPSIGWKVLREPRPGRWTNTICEGLSAGASVYFVHSFAGVPENPEDILAETDFGGHAVCAAIMRGNVVATQFHPEKSGPVGLEMLRRFAEL